MDASLLVFIILLKRSRERTDHVHSHLVPQLQAPLLVDVRAAVDALRDDLQSECNALGVTVAPAADLGNSQLACFLSHMQVWRAIVSDSHPFAVVLEDDAVVNDPPHFASRIATILAELPPNWEMVFLYVTPSRRITSSVYDVANASSISTSYFTYGTVGYMISQAGARKLLQSTKTIQHPVDVQIQHQDRSKFFMSKLQLVSTVGDGGDLVPTLHSTIW